MQKTLVFFNDPGHGWLQVDMYLLRRAGFKPSQYSYSDRMTNMVYLEEDCDAPNFLQALKLTGTDYRVIQSTKSGSFIRKLPRVSYE